MFQVYSKVIQLYIYSFSKCLFRIHIPCPLLFSFGSAPCLLYSRPQARKAATTWGTPDLGQMEKRKCRTTLEFLKLNHFCSNSTD